MSGDAFKLGQFCHYHLKLIKSYLFVNDLNVASKHVKTEPPPIEEKKTEDGEKEKEETENKEGESPVKVSLIQISNNSIKFSLSLLKKVKKLSEQVHINEEDLKNYLEMKQKLVERKQARKRVKFTTPESNKRSEEYKPQLNLSKYISCFDPMTTIHSQSSQSSQQQSNPLRRFYDLAKTTESEEKKRLGSFLFTSMLSTSEFDPKAMQSYLCAVPVRKIVLLDLLVHAWMSESFSDPLSLYKLVYFLSGCARYLNDPKYEITTDETENKEDEKEVKEGEVSLMTFDADEGDNNEDFLNSFVGDYLVKFKSLSESSSSLVETLLLTWIIRSILIQVNESEKAKSREIIN